MNITEVLTNNNDAVEDVVFDDRHTSDESGDEQMPKNFNDREIVHDSFSENESHLDGDDDDNDS